MKFNNEELKFDRKSKCDWCGKKTDVGITHYGTSNYNRLICKECVQDILKYEEIVFGKKIEQENKL